MRSYLKEKVAAPVYKTEINSRGVSASLTTRHPSPTGGGRLVDIIRLRTKARHRCFGGKYHLHDQGDRNSELGTTLELRDF
jgi:hypothetical protein